MHAVNPSALKYRIGIQGWFIIMILVLTSNGCQSQTIETEMVTPAPTAIIAAAISPTTPPTPTPTLGIIQRYPVEWRDWESGAHALVSTMDCSTCHIVKDSQLEGEPIWLNQQASDVMAEDANEFCGQCHSDIHNQNMESPLHSDFSCTTCHDPHSQVASCTMPGCHSSYDKVNPLAKYFPHPSDASGCDRYGCHEVILVSPTLDPSQIPWNHRDSNHNEVSCEACHDASGLEVGRQDGIWVPVEKVDSDGTGVLDYFSSHNIQRSVDCTKCHFADNPWKITESLNSADEDTDL